MSPVSVGKRLASLFDRFADHVETVIILMTNRARRIEQQVAFVAAEIEHVLAAPIRMAKLFVEVSELRRFHKLRSQRLLLRRSPPQMNLFDHKPQIFTDVSFRKRSSSEARFDSSPCNQPDRSITVKRERNNTISCSGVVGLPGTPRPAREASLNRRTCDH